MKEVVKKAFRVSDGLASLTQKKIKSLISELEREGVLTKAEGSKAYKKLSKVKTGVYDIVSRELKKVLVRADRATKRVKKKVSKKKRK